MGIGVEPRKGDSDTSSVGCVGPAMNRLRVSPGAEGGPVEDDDAENSSALAAASCWEDMLGKAHGDNGNSSHLCLETLELCSQVGIICTELLYAPVEE